jgi:UDP-N-acetylglucosamine--N-acetylmuramyl-(pentapeptide) pyrophosphoryl-undecaprenol N-acetylglucosamine transferase
MTGLTNGRSVRALIMAAGTGGHIYPGLALAHALQARGGVIEWLGTPTGMEQRLVPAAGLNLRAINMRGVRAKGVLAWLKLPFMLLRAMWQSWRIVGEVKPTVVVSMGGYVAFPAGVVAWLKRIPLVVFEPGAHAGLSNRALSLFATRNIVGFPDTYAQVPKNTIAKLLPLPKNILWLGTPVREEIAELPPPAARMMGRTGALRLLIVGGSLGAQSLNTLIVDALALLPKDARPTVTHQAGVNNIEQLKAEYAKANVVADAVAFIDDMAAMYAWCDLVICRSGAITVAELSVAGVAAILVPLPHFVAEEQEANARFLVDRNAGVLVLQPETNAAKLSKIISDCTRARAIDIATRARALAKPDATAALTDVCEELSHAR